MTESNKPAFRAVVAEEKGQGENARTRWTSIGAAWPTKSGKGLNVHLQTVPTNWDGRFTLVEPDDAKSAGSQAGREAA